MSVKNNDDTITVVLSVKELLQQWSWHWAELKRLAELLGYPVPESARDRRARLRREKHIKGRSKAIKGRSKAEEA